MAASSKGEWWMLRRLAPCVAMTLAATVAAGLVRGAVLFVPGILGMVFGGLAGWACGRLGRHDREELWSFDQRKWLTLGAALLYGVGTAATVSVLNTRLMGLPLDWLADVLKGHAGELFSGYSTNSYQSVSGALSGGWWLVFSLVDVGLFGFLYLVMSGVALSPGGGDGTDEAETDEDEEAKPDGGMPAPPPTGAPTVRTGPASFAVFAAVSVLAILGLHWWPTLGLSPAPVADPLAVISELQGDWVFGEEGAFLGRTAAERSFTLSRGLGTELAGFSAVPMQFMLSMEQRRDGVFDGSLNLGARGLFSVRMRPLADGSELVFVVDWPTRSGFEPREVRARRRPVEGT